MAEAATCLGFQDPKYPWDFMIKITTSNRPYDESKINIAALNTGADYEKFRACLSAHESLEKVNQQVKAGKTLGVTAKPTVIIGGQVFAASVPEEQVLSAIKQLIE